jgi:hypothetical protein
MMSFGTFPDETGIEISELNPGDEILINYVDENRKSHQKVAVVWKIDQYSGLTTNGEPLSCGMGITIIPTGNHYKNYTVARDAREFILKMGAQRGLETFDSEAE